MKTIIIETLALLACIILLSCNKSDIQNNFNPCAVDPCNCTGIDSIKLNYSLKWNQPFHLKSNRSVSTTPFTIGDVLITSYLSDDGLFSIVNGNNSLTGEKIWEQLYNKSDKAVLHHYGTKHNYNNSLILTFNFHIYAINPMNGSVIWDVTKVPENIWSDPSSAIIDNNIYYGGRTIDQNPKKSFLFRRDLNYPQINEVLLEYTDPDNYDFLLGMPCLTINHYKDSILIFIGKGFNQDNSKSNYFAYNLNNKQIEWIREFYGADGKWQAPIIVNNKIIVAPTSTSVACLDATTGDLIWQKELPDKGFMQTGDMVIEEGVLLVLNNMGSLYAFHPETGEELWKQQTAEWASSPVKMEAHKGILYVANGGLGCQLSAWDVHTGANYWCEYSVNAICKPDCFISSSGLTIDKERGLLYTTDGYDILCIKTIR